MKELKLENWKLCSSQDLNFEGNVISSPLFDTENWYNTLVPSTVLATLVENGIYKDPYYGLNLKDIPSEKFKCNWWYRTEFELSAENAKEIVLISFNGINYKANIWINGIKIADQNSVNGAYRMFQFDISNIIKSGTNTIAVEVIPPQPGDFTVGFVDWNPNPPDHNLGIFREVTLSFNKGVAIQNPYVESKIDLDNLNQSELKVTTELENYKDTLIKGKLVGVLDNIKFIQNIELAPKEKKLIIFDTNQFKQLVLENPKLWWPNNLGEPNLYQLKLSFICAETIVDEVKTKFGIRKVEDYVNEGGHKGFKINGHKVLIRGAGWTDDLLLQDSYQTNEAQIKYVKDMNLNCIRLEGFWGKDQSLYDLCDENGILIMVGWSCEWEHEDYLGKPIDPRYGGVIEPDEIELISRSWEDQLLWLRNHPSIFVWTVGSDMLPHPDLERKYIETFKKYDNSRPYLNSTGGVGSEQGIITTTEIISEISGSSRVKMLGPYAYTPPIYWYINDNLGGAYGFNTETCPGANIPPLASLKKMIPENSLWPIDDVWNYHCGKFNFGHIDRTQVAIEKRYGKPTDVEDFAKKAQLLNYELMRPMFEAFQANKKNATGIIQWMLNSAWPEMYWQLYDSYLMPNGAYYGAKNANSPVHLLYNYGNKSIYKVNDTVNKIENYKALIRVYNINSELILSKSIDLNIESESSELLMSIEELDNLTTVYFLDLRIFDNEEKEIDNNFYWLSKVDDILDYETKVGDWAFHTPSKQYADFTELYSLPNVELEINKSVKKVKNKNKITITLKNKTNIIAFFIEMLLVNKKSKDVILPVFWSDNYISLLPNESREIEAEYVVSNDNIEDYELTLTGWNIKD